MAGLEILRNRLKAIARVSVEDHENDSSHHEDGIACAVMESRLFSHDRIAALTTWAAKLMIPKVSISPASSSMTTYKTHGLVAEVLTISVAICAKALSASPYSSAVDF